MSDPGIEFLKPETLFHGRYRVVRRLQIGGMGAVYEVVDERIDTPRALKIMLPGVLDRPEMRARFAREARVTGAIESDHIVSTMDAGIDEESGIPFLVMELLRGEDLAATLTVRGALPSADVVTYLFQAALALEKTHTAGIVHCDLKPENLFLTRRDDGSPRLKILDFGIAKLIAQSTAGAATKGMGTLLYMAPEQARSRSVGPRADLYALAHVAYTLLSGAAYWSEELDASPSIVAFLTAVSRGVREPPSRRAARRNVSLTPRFDSWFLRATAPRQEDRFHGALALIEALAEALDIPLRTDSSPGPAPAGLLEATLPAEDSTAPSTLPGRTSEAVAAAQAEPAARRRARKAARESNPAAGSLKKQVLWVDDDRFALSSMSFWLTDRGYEVVPARTPTEAIRVLRSPNHNIACAIIDLHLPGPSSPIEPAGLRLARAIHKEWPSISLICLSNVVSAPAVEWFGRYGAGYFHKLALSGSLQAFTRTIEEALTGRRPPPSALVVHGKADALLSELRGYLTGELGWPDVRVLQEIPSRRRSVAQKFNDEAREAEIVFVLLSPEDATFAAVDQRPGAGGKADLGFELGYLLGSSKRRACPVVVLTTGGATLPVEADGIEVIDASAGLASVKEQVRLEVLEWVR
jgi:serine/threonine protein kinase